MDNIRRNRPTTIGLLAVMFSVSVLATGCSSKTKTQSASTVISNESQTSAIKQLAAPSLNYLLNDTNVENASELDAEQWMQIAKRNYASKHYARALRAATEALSIDDEQIEARQIAMLSAVKVTETNIDSYNNNTLMNSADKVRLKSTFENMTSLINAQD